MNNNNAWKLMIPVILVALFGYQTMQSKEPQTAQGNPQPPPTNPQNPPTNPQNPPTNPQNPPTNPQNPPANPQNPPTNPQNSDLSPLFGTWRGDVLNGNSQSVAIFQFHPNGTFQIQQMNMGNNGTSLEAVISGAYKRTGENSYIFLPEKRCDGTSCYPGGEPKVFTISNSNEILFNGITFRRIS